MARVIKAPQALPFTVFLAGSIEMGAARNWQEEVTSMLPDDIIVLNPRRDDWDSTWKQDIANPHFREQVEWELTALERADVIAMHFEPNTKSPITLLELGLFIDSGKIILHCPHGFWRKGNVDIVAHRYGAQTVSGLEEMAEAIMARYKLGIGV